MSLAERPSLPSTPQQAQHELNIWQTKLELAQVSYQCAWRQLQQARADLDIVEKIAAGAFDDNAPLTEEVGYYGVRPVREHCVGSRGPWSWAL